MNVIIKPTNFAIDMNLLAIRPGDSEIAVLADKALGLFVELLRSCVGPPLLKSAISIIFSALVVKCMLKK